jgi:hypothetical protein
MPKISETAILRRAKALCKQDGKNWDFAFTPSLPPQTKIGEFFLDEEGRRQYLGRARQHLVANRRAREPRPLGQDPRQPGLDALADLLRLKGAATPADSSTP